MHTFLVSLFYAKKYCLLPGAGVFVTTIVAGVIAIICPFDAMQRPFLRDIIFFIAALFWTFYILWDHKITKFEAIGMLKFCAGNLLLQSKRFEIELTF